MSLSPHYPQFRLNLDEPYDFAREPGFVRAVHCHDFREDALSLWQNTWRCPVTGLVFLTPSWLNEDYQAGFEPLASWTSAVGLWEEAKRAMDEISSVPKPMGLLSSSVVNLGNPIDWGVLTVAGIIARVSLMDDDELQWALESTFTLAEDEGFVLHLNKITDSLRRHVNYMAVQWDNVQIHIRPNGQLAVYRWADRADIGDESAADLVEEFFLSSPGEMADKDTYFFFLPIPSVGLLVYHSHTPQRFNSKISSARSGSVKGHLVNLPSEERPDSANNYRMLRASKIGIALTKTPRAAHVIGFHRLRFPSVGTYLDSIFSLPYIPSVTETSTLATPVPTGRGSLSSALVTPDGTFLFAAGDKQGRVKAIFGNGGSGVYTPFLLGADVLFPRVMTTRDTTALRLTNTGGVWDPADTAVDTRDLLQRLEITESDDGRVEGKAAVYAKSDHLKSILQRGDCTWKIERQDDEESDWATMAGGIARWEDADVGVCFWDAGDDDTLGFGEGTRRRMAYKATLSLSDMWARFPEVHQTLQTAFDGVTIGEAIDTVLLASGFAVLGGTVPPEMESIRLPKVPKGENWRHGTQEGDDGGAILRQLLLYPRKQLSQFRLLYDWDTAVWSCEKVLKLTGPDNVFWWFTPDVYEARGDSSPDGAPEAEFRVEYGVEDEAQFTFRVYPPEANLIRPFGLEKPGADARRVAGQPLENVASIDDNTSRDYLGRCVMATPMLAPLVDETQIAKFGRIVYEAIAHRRLVIKLPASGYEPLLTAGTHCHVRGFDAEGELVTMFDGWWLRRKTVVLDYLGSSGDIPQSVYTLDEQWDLPID